MNHYSNKTLLQHYVLPLQAVGMAMNYSVAIADMNQYIFYLPSDKLDLHIEPGDPIPAETAIRRSLTQGSVESMRGSADTFGISYLVRTFPLKDEKGKIQGACALLKPTESEDKIKQLSAHLSTSIKELSQTSTELTKKMEKMKLGSDHLMKSTDRTGDTIAESKSITDFVRTVARKSGILSMNAVIEAARSGGHNGSFNVIAKEMRNLSQNTEASIEKIENILGQRRIDSKQSSEAVIELHSLVTTISKEMDHIFSTIRQVNEAASSLLQIASTL